MSQVHRLWVFVPWVRTTLQWHRHTCFALLYLFITLSHTRFLLLDNACFIARILWTAAVFRESSCSICARLGDSIDSEEAEEGTTVECLNYWMSIYSVCYTYRFTLLPASLFNNTIVHSVPTHVIFWTTIDDCLCWLRSRFLHALHWVSTIMSYSGIQVVSLSLHQRMECRSRCNEKKNDDNRRVHGWCGKWVRLPLCDHVGLYIVCAVMCSIWLSRYTLLHYLSHCNYTFYAFFDS